MRRTALNFFALAVAMGAVLSITGPVRLYWALRANGVTIQGTITVVDCRKSTLFLYRFIAEGHSYTGSGTTIQECSKFKERTYVPVTYLATDPTQNFSGDPTRALINYALASLVACVLLPGAATIAIHLRRKHAHA